MTSDADLQEFRLEGKSLAFLVISAIVVAVVVFLCGVMVGRGVRSRTVDPVEVASSALDPTEAPPLVDEIPEPKGTSATPDAELTYPSRLEGGATPDALDEPLASSKPSRPEPPPAPAAPPPAPEAALREPKGKGYVVQVMSVTQLPEAENVARRLKSKGYPSFVSEAAGRYRVRIGTFPDRRDAQAAATRLEKEERFRKPWITNN